MVSNHIAIEALSNTWYLCVAAQQSGDPLDGEVRWKEGSDCEEQR